MPASRPFTRKKIDQIAIIKGREHTQAALATSLCECEYNVFFIAKKLQRNLNKTTS